MASEHSRPQRRRRALAAIAAVAIPATLGAGAALALTDSPRAAEPPVPDRFAPDPDGLMRLATPNMILATPTSVNRAIPAPAPPEYDAIPNRPNGVMAARPAPPARLQIEELDIDVPLQPVGATLGGIEVPPTDRAGWYADGPRPGEPGRTVLIGHRDDSSGPAVFADLPQIEPGTEIVVTGADGESRSYVASRAMSVPKDTYPAEAVHDPTAHSTLVLVTCGGDFLASGHYENSVIVFAGPSRS